MWRLTLGFVVASRTYTLMAHDAQQRGWDFVVKSWANGEQRRRVFVLEQAAPFLRAHHVAEGDVLGMRINTTGGLVVEARTCPPRVGGHSTCNNPTQPELLCDQRSTFSWALQFCWVCPSASLSLSPSNLLQLCTCGRT